MADVAADYERHNAFFLLLHKRGRLCTELLTYILKMSTMPKLSARPTFGPVRLTEVA